jgi:hypothetical protein
MSLQVYRLSVSVVWAESPFFLWPCNVHCPSIIQSYQSVQVCMAWLSIYSSLKKKLHKRAIRMVKWKTHHIPTRGIIIRKANNKKLTLSRTLSQKKACFRIETRHVVFCPACLMVNLENWLACTWLLPTNSNLQMTRKHAALGTRFTSLHTTNFFLLISTGKQWAS